MGITIDTVHATGGAAANRSILQTMADVFGAEVWRFEVANSAALGAALRAAHADLNVGRRTSDWDEVIRGFVEPVAELRVVPDARSHAMYQELIQVHAACEAHALGRGPDPAPLISRFRER
jgi:sugar (pentulose or hexulose) kinase